MLGLMCIVIRKEDKMIVGLAQLLLWVQLNRLQSYPSPYAPQVQPLFSRNLVWSKPDVILPFPFTFPVNSFDTREV